VRLELLTEAVWMCVTGGQSQAFFNLIKYLHHSTLPNSMIGLHKKFFRKIYSFTETYFPEYDLLLRYDFLSFLVIAK